MSAKNTTATIVPTMRYRDPNGAVEWLGKAFGLKKKAAFTDDKGKIVHAELTFGNGMIMIGGISDTPFSKFLRQPKDVGGVTTSLYAIVEDIDGHCGRAKAAGAEILLELKTQDYGGRDYTCRDPEGHVWSFGTYDPWAQ